MKKEITIRKDQQCHTCDKPILKGTKAIKEEQRAYLSNQLLGIFYHHILCLTVLTDRQGGKGDRNMEELNIKEEAEPIRMNLLNILAAFGKLIDKGCVDNCKNCCLNETIVPEGDEAYEYATGKLYGTLTACDFLGILYDEMNRADQRMKSK